MTSYKGQDQISQNNFKTETLYHIKGRQKKTDREVDLNIEQSHNSNAINLIKPIANKTN